MTKFLQYNTPSYEDSYDFYINEKDIFMINKRFIIDSPDYFNNSSINDDSTDYSNNHQKEENLYPLNPEEEILDVIPPGIKDKQKNVKKLFNIQKNRSDYQIKKFLKEFKDFEIEEIKKKCRIKKQIFHFNRYFINKCSIKYLNQLFQKNLYFIFTHNSYEEPNDIEKKKFKSFKNWVKRVEKDEENYKDIAYIKNEKILERLRKFYENKKKKNKLSSAIINFFSKIF